ncbi:hypothetical protein Tco_1347529 [Tanacetum coccineum]
MLLVMNHLFYYHFFLPEEIVSPQKRARFLSSSSTDSSAPPHVFEIGESSYVTRLERLEEQINAILNHLDELPLERIEQMEGFLLWRCSSRILDLPPIRYEESSGHDP